MIREKVPFDKRVFALTFSDIIRSEKLYVSPDWNNFSTSRFNDSYKTFKESINSNYPGFEVNPSTNTLQPRDVPRVNLEDLKKLLLSKADSFNEEESGWIF